jgi:hypothetical protein
MKISSIYYQRLQKIYANKDIDTISLLNIKHTINYIVLFLLAGILCSIYFFLNGALDFMFIILISIAGTLFFFFLSLTKNNIKILSIGTFVIQFITTNLMTLIYNERLEVISILWIVLIPIYAFLTFGTKSGIIISFAQIILVSLFSGYENYGIILKLNTRII